MCSIREHGKGVGIHGTGCGIGITLYARYLYQSSHRITGKTQMMFQTHLCSILYLCGRASKQLACRCSCHGTGYSHLTLATHFCTADAGIMLHHVSKEACCGESTQDAHLRHLTTLPYMIKNTWKHSTTATGGCRHYQTTAGILLNDCQSIRKDKSSASHAGLITFGLGIIAGCLATKIESARQSLLMFKATFHSILHHMPNLCQIIPYLRSFTITHIFPKRLSRLLSPMQDFRSMIHLIDMRRLQGLLALLCQSSSTHAKHRPGIVFLTLGIHSTEAHTIGMKRQEDMCLPGKGGTLFAQYGINGPIGSMSTPCGRQTAV